MSSRVIEEAESRYGDAILSFVGLVGAVLSTVLVLSGQAPGQRAGQQAQAIAEVSFASSDIRRRPAQSLTWDDISHGAVVREQDSIFVPPGAGAQITFTNGSRLDLDENSLVVLEAPLKAAPRVGLKKGGLSGSTLGQGLEIDSEQGKTSLSGNTEARVDLRETGPRVEVFAGKAKVVAPAGERTVAANQVGGVAAGGTLDPVVSRSVQLELPRRNERVFYRGAPGPVTLSWSGEVPANASLQVARDRGFGFIVHSAPVGAAAEQFDPAGPGIYWWRLADEAGQSLSEARRLTLIEDVPPVALSPAAREVVWETDGHPLAFAWTEVAGAGNYRLELSADPQFHSVLVTATAEQPRLVVEQALDEATYFWRVRADDRERGDAAFSRVSSFRLIHKALPDAPELMNPEIEVDPEPKPE